VVSAADPPGRILGFLDRSRYVDCSTNQKLQGYYEHLRTVREILINEQQQRSVQTKLDSFFKPASLRSKTSTTFEPSMDEKMYYLFAVFKKGLYSDTF
jgi:hypothetical protein